MFVSAAFAQSETHSQPAETQAVEHGAPGAAPETLHTETGVPHDAGHTGVFPPFDSTYYASQLLWLAITFGAFYLFLSRVALPRLGGVIEARRGQIEQDLDHAGRMKEDADNAIAAYEQELAEARMKAGRIAGKARDEAKTKADAERATVEASLEAKLAEAEARIAAIKEKAMQDVGSIAEGTAADIVEHLVGGIADKASVSAAVKAAS
ncbi:F0F1 ATP synthase subunit B [Phyllobacterium leguminum]|uniref:ATP synthase subunit b n=1 Tax=Phyllobacterium leguminum TaxID=314237 RepID=A0A318TFU9_9HYPH|nr:F0F1 ATP synthase subunit B [Phyllobacterium leguminum]PYE90552.1 F-type H+-transporting ATPase subunit b [Phyllobacterium leguminum]